MYNETRCLVNSTVSHMKSIIFFISLCNLVLLSSCAMYGNTIERPLAIDGFIEYAKSDSIYWLDPDGNETKIQIIEENGYKRINSFAPLTGAILTSRPICKR